MLTPLELIDRIAAVTAMTQVAQVVTSIVSSLLLRPCEVLSRIAHASVLKVAHNALRALLQHRHVLVRSLA